MLCNPDGHNSSKKDNLGPRHKTQASSPTKLMQTYAVRILRRGGRSFEEQPNPQHVLHVWARDVALRQEQRGQLQELLATRLIIFVMP